MPSKPHATIREVARLAGVSTATVSAVLNGSPVVSEKRTARVRDAVAALDYHPDTLARGLRTGRTQLAAILVPDITNPFFAEVIRGVEDAAATTDYSVIVCDTNENAVQEHQQLSRLLAGRVDGLLITCSNLSANYDIAIRRGTPVVFIDRGPPHVDAPVIGTDHLGGAFDITRHLISLGHEKIAVMSRDTDLLAQAARVEGFRRAMQTDAIPVRDDYVKLGGKGEADGYNFGCDLLSLNDPPTAVFSCNNKMMAGLLRACGEGGVRCPEDLSIAGFDDHIWMRAYNPPLTVVAQDAYRIGHESMLSLMKLIAEPDNKQPADPIWLPCQVMVRSSTGAPRAKKLQLSNNFSKRFDFS